MWIFALLTYCLFHLLAVRWYLGLRFADPIKRPIAWTNPWFHRTVVAISLALIIASATLFYLSSRWLALAPFALFAASLLLFQIKQGRRLRKIVSKAAQIQAGMEAKGCSQAEIVNAVCLGTTGISWDRDRDGEDVKSFLKSFVLVHEMGLSVAENDWQQLYEEIKRETNNGCSPNHRPAPRRSRKSASQRIDEMFDNYYEREKRALAYAPRAQSRR